MKAQSIDENGMYYQNYTFPTGDNDIFIQNDILKIGRNVTNTLPQGDVIVPSGANILLTRINPSSRFKIEIQPGFKIETGSFFSFAKDITVGNNSIKNDYSFPQLHTNIVLSYGADGESLNIDPMYFPNPNDKNTWGLETYNNGLNFWKPAINSNPSSGNYKMYIASSNGYIGIGTGSPAYKLDVKGNISSTGRLYTSSDKRLKSNIAQLKECSSSLYKLQGKSYTKKIIDENTNSTTENNQDINQFGLIAQDTAKVFPNIVSKDSAGVLSIKYLELLPVIIETLKEQKETYDRNTEKIKQLKEYINTL